MYFVRFVLFCTDAVNDFLDKNCPYVAAAISFYSLFSFFPLVLAIISIYGFVLGTRAEGTELAEKIAEVIPVSTEFVSTTVRGVVSARTITGIASVLGLLWASSAAFAAMRKGINAAWGVKKTRPFLRERLMDVALVLSGGALMMVILFLTPVFAFLREITDAAAPEADVVSNAFWGLAPQLITPVLVFLTFLAMYRFLPNTEVSLSDVWIGALPAALAFEGAKWGFIWYVKTFPVYNVVYGSIGAIMALLTWVYVSAIILLFGALVTSRYASYAAKERDVHGLKLVWAGLSRVRLRVVAAPVAG